MTYLEPLSEIMPLCKMGHKTINRISKDSKIIGYNISYDYDTYFMIGHIRETIKDTLNFLDNYYPNDLRNK